jgi:hypothetical protein
VGGDQFEMLTIRKVSLAYLLILGIIFLKVHNGNLVWQKFQQEQQGLELAYLLLCFPRSQGLPWLIEIHGGWTEI